MGTIIISVLLMLLIGTVWIQWYFNRKDRNVEPPRATVVFEDGDNLSKLVQIMREEKEDKQREQRDRELIDYAKSKRIVQPPAPIQSSLLHEDEPVRGGSDAVPYGLSPLDKEILREFYKRS